jgi:hypothetical protein
MRKPLRNLWKKQNIMLYIIITVMWKTSIKEGDL